MSTILTKRGDGVALFIDGYLQFDSRDEALYHESLALPALELARRRLSYPPGTSMEGGTGIRQTQNLKSTDIQSASEHVELQTYTTPLPRGEAGESANRERLEPQALEKCSGQLRILICGGGDGLALRECLRFPGVTHVDLVDLSEEVLSLARNELADLNDHSLEDKRVKVHLANAWDWQSEEPYDVVLCDFTFPSSDEEAKLLSKEWFSKVHGLLTPNGVACINAVSPQKTPEAFWCVVNSIRAARMNPLPMRICIPSFRELGYGVWGFVLASPNPLRLSELRVLESPVETRQADISKLWRGARFARAERLKARSIPPNTCNAPVLMQLLLNPESVGQEGPLPDIEDLINAIPIQHPSHTREMIQTLAEQVAGTLKSIDLRRLVDEILALGHRLSDRLRFEIEKLKEFLRTNFSLGSSWREWSTKLFATLIIVLTLANSLAPENAFAKGHAGLGHSSMSRGSFSRTGEFSHVAAPQVGTVTGTGFRSSTFGGRNGPVDIYGYRYAPRVYSYIDPYYGGGYYYGNGGYYGGYGYGGSQNQQQQQQQQQPPMQSHDPAFVADDDMMVMDNGDVVVTLSDDAFLVAKKGTMTLMSQKAGPLMPVATDSAMFQRMSLSLEGQRLTAQLEAKSREEWLQWTGWTASMFSSVREDRLEVKNLKELQTRLETAISGMGAPASGAAITPDKDATELFVGAYILNNNTVVFDQPDGKRLTLNGDNLIDATGATHKAPTALKQAVVSIINKLAKEINGDMASYDSDIRQDQSDLNSSHSDLQQYQYYASTYGGGYQVDYGTDEISADDAVSRTQADIDSLTKDSDEALGAKTKAQQDLVRMQTVLKDISDWSTT
ncbi:MAG TPA: hypothetical protein VGL56_11455 [Fimbriimonadaceae bacterium]|jgi:spermidine synthase